MPYDEGEKPVKFNLNIGDPYCKKSKSMLAKVYQLLEVCSAQVARTEPICLQLKKIKKAEQFMPVMRRLIQDPITKQLLIECLTEIRSIDLARYQKWFDLLDKLESGFVSESDYQEFKQFEIFELEKKLRLHERVPEWIYVALKKAEYQQQFVPIISNLLHDPQTKPLFLEFLRENYSLLDEKLFKFINKIKAETLSEQDVEVFWEFGAYDSIHYECFNRLKEEIYSFLTNDMPWNITGIERLLGMLYKGYRGDSISGFETAIYG